MAVRAAFGTGVGGVIAVAAVAAAPRPVAAAPAVDTAWMSQPCRWNSMNVASTPYGRVLVMPAGQVALQRTIHRTRPVTSDIEDL